METLRVGSRFPDLEIPTIGGGRLRLPDDLRGHPAVLLFYRGHW